MLRWNMDMSGVEVNDAEAAIAVAGEDRLAPGVLFNHVVELLAMTLSRIGVTSAAAVVAIAILVATVLLGVTATDAAALGQFCSKC